MAENQAGGQVLESPPPLPIYYMKLNQDQVDARLGKLRRGQIVALTQAQASRWAMAGIADQVSADEYDDTRERRARKVSARQDVYRSLNEQAGMWDVSTYRDVLTASEQGLQAAYEAGLPLVNVTMLRDEDGDPLPPDASLEEIFEARQNMHADLVAPLAAHDRSSVMGGGSPYEQNVRTGPMPLNPMHRAMAENIARHDSMAQRMPASLDVNRRDPSQPSQPTPRGGRAAQHRSRTLQGNQSPSTGSLGQPPQNQEQQAPPAPPPSQGTIPQPDAGDNKS